MNDIFMNVNVIIMFAGLPVILAGCLIVEDKEILPWEIRKHKNLVYT